MGNKGNYLKRDVESSHQTVANGVRFNVEKTASIGNKAFEEYDLLAEMKDRPLRRYTKTQFLYTAYPEEKFLSLKIEASSLGAAKNVIDSGCFFQAAYRAFSGHYPLIIRPGISFSSSIAHCHSQTISGFSLPLHSPSTSGTMPNDSARNL